MLHIKQLGRQELAYDVGVTPTLNWKECAALAKTLEPELQGLFVDRVVVPERREFSAGSLKHEWVIRLGGRRSEAALFFSVRPRHPYLALSLSKGPKAAPDATHSPFSLNLAKQLKGAKILGLEAMDRERILVLWMTADGLAASTERMGLVLCMIPAVPEALLIRARGKGPWLIQARSRNVKDGPEAFEPPTGAAPPADLTVREELFAGPEAYYAAVTAGLKTEAFELRKLAAERTLRDLIKQARERVRQSGTALREAEREADWLRYGELLKATMHELPADLEGDSIEVMDYAADERLRIPRDPKLDLRAQVTKFFSLARRRARRIEEARLRVETFGEHLRKWEAALTAGATDMAGLERLERAAGTQPASRAQTGRTGPGKGGKVSTWLGKSFVSKEGLIILAGRSKDENLELTFKHARGNDVWLHVRGRPGAHVIVPLAQGKSAPLETLLDAATLAIYYSGGEKWGKTEVDYTYKKYVRRIKDSTEASYTNNKTLLVAPDPARIKRLLDSQRE